jgi:hypothetical protein
MAATRERRRAGPRRWTSALLALVVLLAAVMPAAAWQAPRDAGLHAASQAGGDCDPHAGSGPAGPDEHRGHAPPGLACCAALHCPMLPAALPRGVALPAPDARDLAQRVGLGRFPPGLAVRPALPPPRA